MEPPLRAVRRCRSWCDLLSHDRQVPAEGCAMAKNMVQNMAQNMAPTVAPTAATTVTNIVRPTTRQLQTMVHG